ncbi:MAG: hypothetical protein WB816_05045 [Methylocystis sp.]
MTSVRIEIVVDRRGSRRWHERLRDRLARLLPGSAIQFRLVDGADSFPTAITQLLALERLLLRRSRPTLSDGAGLAKTEATPDFEPSIIIDCAGREQIPDHPSGALLLRPLYDGHAGELAAAASLLAGVCPSIALENVDDGTVVATGLPSLEAADGLIGGLEAVVSRVITLIEKTLLSPPGPSEARKPAKVAPTPRPLAFLLRNMAFHCAREIYHLCCYSPHWRVGWRFTDGPGVLETGGLSGVPWRALTNLGDAYAADPFPIEWRGKTCIFFEQFDHRVGKGRIFAREFESDQPVGAPFLVLEEPWHLSYPFLIAHRQELYLIPEASLSGAVSLYRCVEFPRKWEIETQLLTKIEAADATIFRHANRYWMTSVIRDGIGGYSDTLAIHHAPDLFGPWEEHAQRPVLVDSRLARPAGAVVERDGALWRPIQDCSTGYGKKLALARIDLLDPENFSQTMTRVIPPGPLWPGNRLHTLNRWGRLECIDGAVFTPKNRMLRRLTSRSLDR